MIKLTRRDKQELILNSDLIETIEETPDTVITLTNGRLHLVSESSAQILDKIIEFKAAILCRWSLLTPKTGAQPQEPLPPDSVP